MLHKMDQEFNHPLTYFYKTDLGPCLNLPEPNNSHHDKRRPQKNYGRHYRPGESKPPFLGKGQEKTHLLQEPDREDIIHSLQNIKKSVSKFPLLVPDLKEYLENRCTYFQAGCITKFISNWQMITSDKEILTSVRGTTIEFDTRPPNTNFPQSVFSVEESAIFDSEVTKLLSKHIIETTDLNPYEVISNIFIRPKKDGGHRLTLNLEGLNQFVTYHHFKMETLQSIVRLVEKNCSMASLDLNDAYYTVSVNPSRRKYLRFIWKNVLYQFTCLPNGLSSCTRNFTITAENHAHSLAKFYGQYADRHINLKFVRRASEREREIRQSVIVKKN